MSVRRQLNTAYGVSSPLLDVPLLPVVANRAPNTKDFAAIGTIWIYKAQNMAYVLTSIVANDANWVDISQDTADFSTYTVSTANAVPTALASIDVSDSSAVTISGYYLGTKDDFTATLGGTFSGTFSRQAAGATALVGNPTIAKQSNVGLLSTADIDFITVGNAAELTVTGVAAEAWDWKAVVNVVELP